MENEIKDSRGDAERQRAQSETLVDIVAEMRRFGQRHWMHDEGQNIRLYADRIEAAAGTSKLKS